MKLQHYALHIEPLPRQEGGPLVTVPDLPCCVADRGTVDAAIAEARDAFKAWAAAERQDRGVLRAAAEGVRLNQLAATYLAPRGLAEDSGAGPQRSDGQ